MLPMGQGHFREKTGFIGLTLSRWLNMVLSMWLGTSLAVRAVLWLALGIIMARELALPPYITWLVAFGWLGISIIRLLVGDRRIGGACLMGLVILMGAVNFSTYWWSMETGLAHLVNGSPSITALGQIIDVSKNTASRRSLLVGLEGVLLGEGIRPEKGRVLITQVALPGEILDEDLMIGDQVVVTGRFRQPRRANNPGQFDYCHYLYRRGISLVAYIEGNSGVRKIGGKEDEQQLLPETAVSSLPTTHQYPNAWLWLRRHARLLRDRLIDIWEEHLPVRCHGLLAAMVLGERDLLDPKLEEAFRRTGQAHLLSVSGLHISFIAAGIWLLLRPLPCRNVFKYIITVIVVWLYTLIVGSNPPVVRAAITLSLYFMALACGRGHDPLVATGWAAFMQLLVNPSLLFDASFQLSYGALLGILTLAPILQGWLSHKTKGDTFLRQLVGRVFHLVVISISAQLGILPFLAYYFHAIPWAGSLLGVVTVPLTGVIVPLGLLGSVLGLIVGLQRYLAPLVATLLMVLDKLIDWSATWGWVQIHLSAGSVATWVAYYLVITYIMQGLARQTLCTWLGISGDMTWKGRRKAWLWFGLLLTVSLVYFPLVAPLWRPLEIWFLDVGQGDSIFIATPCGRNIIIDGGGLPPSLLGSSYDVGEDIVLPFLRQRGVRKLDLVVATHFHNDHTQGLAAVLRELPVALLGDNGLLDGGFASIQYKRLLEELEMDGGIRREVLRRGHHLSLSSRTELLVLHPSRDAYVKGIGHNQIIDQNNNSVVIKLRTPNHAILFTGDIDREAQMELVRQHSLLADNLDGVIDGIQGNLGKRLNRSLGSQAASGNKALQVKRQASLHERFGISADLLKIPHHGSREALVYSFLGAVSPKETVISVGTNPFGHPAPEFLNALKLVTGKMPWRTDLMGSIRVRIWGRYLRIDPYHGQPFYRIGNWQIVRGWEMRVRHMFGRV